MHLYRIEKRRYVDNFPSKGSLYCGGRWHKMGMWVLYTSSNIALAKLEAMANSVILPEDRVLLTLALEDSAPLYHFRYDQLPPNWMQIPYPVELSLMVKNLYKSEEYIGVVVPSTQSPRESNYILFPHFKGFTSLVSLFREEAIDFDVRLK